MNEIPQKINSSILSGEGLVLDFEGNAASGIREIGIIGITNFSLKFANEIVVEKDADLISFKMILDKKYEFIVSHNTHIEKNLLRKAFPYSTLNEKRDMKWGPWLDTLKVYQKLYPDNGGYDLKNLANVFLDKSLIEIHSSRYCRKDKSFFHNALFDAICTFLLCKRLSKQINLDLFLY